jgi:FtsP/CotA-like multicopper oxidase with cupredoxin domain
VHELRILPFSRRSFLAAGGGAAVGAFLPAWPGRAASSANYDLIACSGRASLVGAPYPETFVWSYNGAVPGPEIRLRQGERIRITVENRLTEETTVHWHGLRVPIAMDGVPHLTQQPIAPGKTFVYTFNVPEAGTYWYHAHQRSFEQVGRGLYGPLIVEERERTRATTAASATRSQSMAASAHLGPFALHEDFSPRELRYKRNERAPYLKC